MMILRLRVVLALSVLAAGAVLATAFATEWYGGLVPCALCLVERWPYRIAVALGLLGLVLPRVPARIALALLALVILAGAAIAFVHVGVEAKWWPSPLPECAAPHFASGSLAERLASMPAKPAKPCDEPSFLIPGLPLSMAMMNMLFALAFSGAIAIFLGTTRRSGP